MDPSSQSGSDAGVPQGLWAVAVGADGDHDPKALRELAGTYWYCAYAWWRRAGLDPVSTATATLACFERWLGDAPPGAGDSGAARMRGWMLARLPELAGKGVKLIGEAPLEIDRQWAEKRYAEEPAGDPDAIFQRRWALTVIETAASKLRDEYSARGEDKLYAELMGFAGFNQEDGDRYSKVAQRLGQTSGAIRKAVFEFRNRQREILHRLVADTVLDPDDAESEITALLCACDATGPETSTAPLPSLLQGQRPDEILVRAMRSVKMTHNGSGIWQPPTIGEAALLFPQYEIVAIIGRGGMGAVYRGRQVELDRPVAIKLLPLEVSVDPAFADRFRREARAMAKLNHPNIILIHEFGSTSEGHLFFVMEFVEGADLHQMIHGPGVTAEQSLSIISGVCDALAYAHGKGVVHRDIKPANVMVGVSGEVKVADFGLARLLDPGADQIGHTMTGTVMGTPDYMAPEQMRGMNVDHRADIYSLGVMLYEMLCKEVPRGIFDPPSLRVPGLSTGIDQVVIKAMQQQPERRYQSTTEMKTDVAVASGPKPVVHKAPKLVTPPQPLVRSPQPAPKPEAKPAPKAASKPAPKRARAAKASSKKPLAIAAACLVPLLGFGGWFATRDRSGSVPPETAKADPASPGEAQSSAPGKVPVPVPAAKTPAWIQPQLPKPNADGWITIFDGKVLRGAIVGDSNLASNAVRLENGELLLDSCSIRVPLPHTDVAVRFTGMPKGQNLSVRVRRKGESSEGYGCRFDRGKGAPSALTIFYPNYGVLKSVNGAHDSSNFFEGEFRVVGGTQTLLLGGQKIASAADTRIASGDGINISSQGGIAHYKRIEVKILAPAPGGSHLANNPAAIPSPGSKPPPASAPGSKQPLPRPDGKPADMTKPVKVFILMGDYAMLGAGRIGPENTKGTLSYLAKAEKKYPHLLDEQGKWTKRNDVSYARVNHIAKGAEEELEVEWLTVGRWDIGPELQFGHVMGQTHDGPVLILKSCTGNRSLGWDLLPPGSEKFTVNGTTYAGYKDTPDKWVEGKAKTPVEWYGGKQYDMDVSRAKAVLADIGKAYPGAKGYEIAGFVWWQGHKDSSDPVHSLRYEQNLVNLIKSVRKEFDAPEAPFVLATLGQGGWKLGGNGLKIADAQLAVGDPLKHPEFAGNVKTVESRHFWREASESPVNEPGPYHRNSAIYMDVGEALGWAMVEMLKPSAVPSPATPAPGPVAATKDAPFVNSLGMKFVPVPITGGPTDGKRVLFSVWETRVRDYEPFVKETKRTWPIKDSERGPDYPATRVSWDDAKAFCEWMTVRERAAGKIGSGEEYRLPSDHEWSCAVGIGKDEDPAAAPKDKNMKIPGYPWGTGFPPPKGAGNYKGEETGKGNPMAKGGIPGYDDGFVNTAPVGSFAANALGIHDLGGNVWEWCQDWADPRDPTHRVHRGRAYDHASDLLSSWRHSYPPEAAWWNSGFRCVLASSAAAPANPGNATTTPAPPSASADGSAGTIDLLTIIDPAQDVRAGGKQWELRDTVLRYNDSGVGTDLRVPLEVNSKFYELEFGFSAKLDPNKGHRIELMLPNGQPKSEIAVRFLSDGSVHVGPTFPLDSKLDCKWSDPPASSGVLGVRWDIRDPAKSKLEILRDGAVVGTWIGDSSTLSRQISNPSPTTHGKLIGLGCAPVSPEFRKFTMTLLDGEVTTLREPKKTFKAVPATGIPNSLPAPVAPAGDDVSKRLAEIEAEFQAAYDRDIAPGHDAALKDLDTKYLAAVQRELDTVTKAGKNQESPALQDELKRIAAKEPLPQADLESLPESLKRLRSVYRTTFGGLEKDRYEKAKPMLAMRYQLLSKYEAELTRKTRADDASRVRAARDTLPGVFATGSP